MNKNNKYGFTLVELLSVIVILAIILVIAVPKVMSVIEDAKKATLESTAKMIASQAEKAKVQNTVLGKNDEITCDSVAKINDVDYSSCSITFDNNKALVTINGGNKFDGLSVCKGTKTESKAQKEKCVIYGDVDGDGKVTENDVVIVKQFVKKELVPTELQQKAADVTGDGEVKTGDYAMIRDYVNGKISNFPVEE